MRRCSDLQGRVTDPEVNANIAVRYGDRQWDERWIGLGGNKLHPQNHFIIVDCDSGLLKYDFADPLYAGWNKLCFNTNELRKLSMFFRIPSTLWLSEEKNSGL